jgi:hypothetical protein
MLNKKLKKDKNLINIEVKCKKYAKEAKIKAKSVH